MGGTSCCQVDVKTTALAMAITDSELSDEEASILESGGFSVSRATTPQLTDVSEGISVQDNWFTLRRTFSNVNILPFLFGCRQQEVIKLSNLLYLPSDFLCTCRPGSAEYNQ